MDERLPRVPRRSRDGALPTVVLIGAMKCGTSALHRYLDAHPQAAMSAPKELNFFFDAGNWHRGLDWYRRHFPADAAVRGESSPGYTSPDHPEAAARMASVLPDARLVYLVRDPVDRAISQYRHHQREGDERRPLAEALLDPASQYLSRGQYLQRLQPFLEHYPRSRITVIVQEELRDRRHETLRGLFSWLDIDDRFWAETFDRRWHTADDPAPKLDERLLGRLRERFAEDTAALERHLGRPLPWSSSTAGGPRRTVRP